jgi:hypothetical protein
MQTIKVVAVRFQDGVWQIFRIPVPVSANGDAPILLNLDAFFPDRSTNITFKGFGRQGRLLYVETNCRRRIPMDSIHHDNAGQHVRM